MSKEEIKEYLEAILEGIAEIKIKLEETEK